MATWAATTLSTLNSIARHEAEINGLGSTFKRYSIKAAAPATLAISGGLTPTELYGVQLDGTVEELTATIGIYPLSTKNYLSFYTDAGIVWSLLEGTGSPKDTTAQYSLTLTDTTWDELTLQTDWSGKIALAKEIIGNYLLTTLAKLGYTNDMLTTGDTYLNYLSNPESMELMSDYKTLELIYKDLNYKGLNEVYEKKMIGYADAYNAATNDAMYQLGFTFSGGTVSYLYQTMGRLSV